MAEGDNIRKEDDYIEIRIPEDGSKPAQSSSESKPAEKTQDEGKSAEQKSASDKPVKPVRRATKKKSVKKKTAKKKSVKPVKPKKQASDGESNSWIWVLLIIVGIVIIAAVIYLSLPKSAPVDNTPVDQSDSEKQIAAMVNKEPIYISDIDTLYDQLPAQLQAQTTKDSLLDQLIDQELLLQAADDQGIVVSQQELDDYIQGLLDYFGLTVEELDATLAQQGVSREEFDQNNRDQIRITKLINETVYSKIVVTDEMAEEYYNENEDLFTIPPTATVQHILLTPQENETEEELLVRAEEVVDMIDDDFGNFCDLVEEYTQDPASIPDCGEYQVQQNGQYVPAFEEAAFDMAVGDIRIVQSDFGQHIMWKSGFDEAGTQDFETVKDSVVDLLEQQESNLALMKYLDELREVATIEKYPLDGSESVDSEPKTVEEEVEQEEQMEVVVEEPDATTGGQTQETVQEEVSEPVMEEVVEEETTPEDPEEVVDEETPEPVQTGDYDNLGDCLSDKNAKLYGVSWSPGTTEQINMIGDAFDQITYVDCDEDDCEGINIYPTWIIGDVVLEGKVTMTKLLTETGCPA